MSIVSAFFRRGRDRGQSLVEVALFLPILVILIAGVVEVSNLLITQNKITTASRMAAGFGAANYVRTDWTTDGGTADAMGGVAINTVTQTLELSPDLWDVYNIRALTNAAGDAFAEFESKHSYGNNNVVSAAEWSAIEATVRSEMLADLQSTGIESAKNVEVVASIPFHDIDDILGLPIWQWTGYSRLQGMTVMRVRPAEETAACPILPIAVRLQQFSIYPTNWDPDSLDPDTLEPLDGVEPLSMHNIAGDPVSRFPHSCKLNNNGQCGPDNWDHPTDPFPEYLNSADGVPSPVELFVTGASSEFEENDPGVPLSLAILNDSEHRGNLYWARDIGQSGNFGWLSWGGSTSATTLAESLKPPGNFEQEYPPGPANNNTTGDEPQDMDPLDESVWGPPSTGDGDGLLERGEWADDATGNMAKNNQNSQEGLYWIDYYIDNKINVNILVYDHDSSEIPGSQASGSAVMYRAYSFITVRIVGYRLGTNDKWILFEFISSGINCGPNAVTPFP